MNATDDDDDVIGYCEECGHAIMPGDKYTYGGDDDLFFCEEHASTLADQIEWVRDMLTDGTWVDHDCWSDEVELQNYLNNLEAEFLATGNRTMATS